MFVRASLILLIIFSLFVEGTLIEFPLVFVTVSLLLILFPDESSSLFAFIVCLIFDSISLNRLGTTLLFVFGLQIFYHFLKKPLDLATPFPKLVILFFSTILYQIMLGYPFLIALDLITFFLLTLYIKMTQVSDRKIALQHG